MTLPQAIESTIEQCKRDGVVGMSIPNLRQVTPTRGLECTVREYRDTFQAIAYQTARRLGFRIIRK